MLEKQCVYCRACRSFSQYLSPFSPVTHTDTLSDGCREIRLCDIVSWHIAVTDAASWSGLFPPAQFATNCLLLVSDDWIWTSSPLWLRTQQCAGSVSATQTHFIWTKDSEQFAPRISWSARHPCACVQYSHSHLSRMCLLHNWAGKGRGMNQSCRCKCLHFHMALTGSHRRLWGRKGEKKRLRISLGFKLKGCILLKRCCS